MSKSNSSKSSRRSQKEKKGDRIIFSVNCNGSDVGNGVGIGNGNLNGGGGGCGGDGGSSGHTGETGSTGGLVCDAKCNRVCEQFYLEQTVDPTSVSRIGQELTWTLKATNVSGKRVTQPLVVTSSFFGTILLTERGVDAGETVTVVNKTVVEEADLRSSTITSAAFVSYGVPSGRPGGYNPGERVSPVVTTYVRVDLADVNVSGTLTVRTGTGTVLDLAVSNVGSIEVTYFKADLALVFADCDPRLEAPIGSPFTIVDKQLKLNDVLAPGARLTVRILADCDPSSSTLNYEFSSDQGAILSRSVRLAIRV